MIFPNRRKQFSRQQADDRRLIRGPIPQTPQHGRKFQWFTGQACGSHIRILKAVERAAAAMRVTPGIQS
jgi:hypothetical protein